MTVETHLQSAHPPPERIVTVCDACNCASCWQGVLYCYSYQTASTREATVSELKALQLESPSYWQSEDDDALNLQSVHAGATNA